MNETQPTPPPAAPESTNKADLMKRFIAAVIDGVISVIVGFLPVIGGFIGAAYLLLRDGFDLEFMDHRSLGKKVMKLRVQTSDGAPMDFARSAKRNWMFALGGVTQELLFIPIVGWALLPFVALAGLIIGIAECIFALTNDEGRRWGDRLADTKVVESTD